MNCVLFISADVCFLCRGSEGDIADGVYHLPRTWQLVNNRQCLWGAMPCRQMKDVCIADICTKKAEYKVECQDLTTSSRLGGAFSATAGGLNLLLSLFL